MLFCVGIHTVEPGHTGFCGSCCFSNTQLITLCLPEALSSAYLRLLHFQHSSTVQSIRDLDDPKQGFIRPDYTNLQDLQRLIAEE